MTTTTQIRDAIASERLELAEVLTGLPAQAWDSPTLCEGWRVREVVAHITMPFRYSTGKFILEMLRARGGFNRMADKCAREDASSLSSDELLRSLRDNAHHPWKPPGGGFEGALSHDVIHGLDITAAAGIDRMVPKDRLGIIFGGLKPKNVRFFGVALDGVELRADDMEWSYGSGRPVTGAAQDLLLVLCGRKLAAERLRGDDSGRFTHA